MNFYFFEQIPKLAPEKYCVADGVHTGTHGAALMGKQLGLIRVA